MMLSQSTCSVMFVGGQIVESVPIKKSGFPIEHPLLLFAKKNDESQCKQEG